MIYIFLLVLKPHVKRSVLCFWKRGMVKSVVRSPKYHLQHLQVCAFFNKNAF